MQLIQHRLDVKNKTRANLFDWRGQFTPEFVDYILGSFACPDYMVVDPFSGSGTVLLECARRDLVCYGFEINPAAYTMSKFFTFANVVQKKRLSVIDSLQQKLLSLLPEFDGLPLFWGKDSFRECYKNLLEFSQALFSKIANPQEKILALNILFVAEDYKKDNLQSSVMRAFNYTKKSLMELPYTTQVISAGLGDARLVHSNCPSKASLIFTSPPYINVFNYHQNHRAILEVLGWDMLEIAQSEIGSNRKNRGNRFKTVVQYCLDMEQTLKSFWECLQKDGEIVIVIGRESNVRQTPFYNGEIVRDLAEGIGGFRDIHNFTRAFINKFGINLREDIIVLKKSSEPPSGSKARHVSLKHLQYSLKLAPEAVRQDVLAAIESVDAVQPSPLFSVRGEFYNG